MVNELKCLTTTSFSRFIYLAFLTFSSRAGQILPLFLEMKENPLLGIFWKTIHPFVLPIYFSSLLKPRAVFGSIIVLKLLSWVRFPVSSSEFQWGFQRVPVSSFLLSPCTHSLAYLEEGTACGEPPLSQTKYRLHWASLPTESPTWGGTTLYTCVFPFLLHHRYVEPWAKSVQEVGLPSEGEPRVGKSPHVVLNMTH